jgi:hypothetical protein
MYDPTDRMVAKQADIISQLNNKILHLEQQKDHAERIAAESYQRAEFYRILETAIAQNESLKESWDALLITLKLVDPEIEKKFSNVRLTRGYGSF